MFGTQTHASLDLLRRRTLDRKGWYRRLGEPRPGGRRSGSRRRREGAVRIALAA